MKKILVTGGAGYIGTHTVVELIKAGYTPIIIDNLCNTSIQNINGEYFQTTVFKAKTGDGTINDFHLLMDSKCEIIDKENYNKLIKSGLN